MAKDMAVHMAKIVRGLVKQNQNGHVILTWTDGDQKFEHAEPFYKLLDAVEAEEAVVFEMTTVSPSSLRMNLRWSPTVNELEPVEDGLKVTCQASPTQIEGYVRGHHVYFRERHG